MQVRNQATDLMTHKTRRYSMNKSKNDKSRKLQRS